MREAGIQEFFSEGNISPFTLVYEDFIHEYEKTVRKVLEFLELDTMDIKIRAPSLARTAIGPSWKGELHAAQLTHDGRPVNSAKNGSGRISRDPEVMDRALQRGRRT